MAFDFPNTPTVGQIVTGPGGIQYQWDGVKWTVITGVSPGFAPINSPVFTGNPQAPTPALTDSSASLATTAFVQGAASHNVGRNYADNALFRIQQRGAGAWTANSSYTADRYQVYFALDTDSVTVTTLSDAQRAAIGDEAAEFGLLNTFIGNSGAGSYSIIYHKIEKVRRLSGKTVTVSFWAGSSQSLRFGVSFNQVFGTGGSPSPQVPLNGQSVQLTPTATRYSLTFNLPSSAGATLGTNGDDQTQVLFWYSSGATSNVQSGSVGVQNGSIMMWGVQVEIGSQATPLEKLSLEADLARCQRVFQNWQGVFAGQGPGGNSLLYIGCGLPVAMRAVPAMVIVGNSNSGAMTSAGVTAYGISAYYMSSTSTSNAYFYFNMSGTASAEL